MQRYEFICMCVCFVFLSSWNHGPFLNSYTFHYWNLQKKLFHAVLQDPLNKFFFLLSETCIPLHPLPKLRLAFSQSDGVSYVNACPQDPQFAKVVHYDEALRGVNVSIHNFKKSEQWVALQRKHAQLVVDENFIAEKFDRLSIKFPDEHYIPTVLATYHLSSETSCAAGVTYTNWRWWKKPRHPKVENFDHL